MHPFQAPGWVILNGIDKSQRRRLCAEANADSRCSVPNADGIGEGVDVQVRDLLYGCASNLTRLPRSRDIGEPHIKFARASILPL
jgi:hypothetical protein